MKNGFLLVFVLLAASSVARAADDFIDRVDEALVFSDAQGDLRARVSGTLDLEGYHFQLPAPALLYTESQNLFSPRLSLFLDAQLGRYLYVFAQSRADRGFDPSDEYRRLRLDEYAIRFSPGDEGYLNLQLGKFATVVGNWVERHGSWDNPFVTAPLVYESLTGVWDAAAPGSADTLLRWAHVRPNGYPDGSKDDKDLRLPVIWGPSYGSGLAVSGLIEHFQYAFEVKNSALASRPDSWSVAAVQWQNPTFSGRIGYRPNEAWNLGLSASSGSYLRPSASASLAPGYKREDYREIVVGQDLSFAWHHLQLWAEVYEVRFHLPRVGDADTVSYYVEAKYKFTAQFFAAVRWNQQLFGSLRDSVGNFERWGRDVWRFDFAPAYRFTPHTQLKFQYSLQRTAGPAPAWNNIFALQSTVRF
jgi:hypothetical protein